jgi:hypothetical protein
MSLSRRLSCLSLFAVLAGAGTSVLAAPQSRAQDPAQRTRAEAPRQQRESPPGHERRGDQRALSDAVRRAERATRGQVLSAERVQYDGRDLNRVKVVDDRGRVRVYWDDPQGQAEPEEEAPRARRTRDDDGSSD